MRFRLSAAFLAFAVLVAVPALAAVTEEQALTIALGHVRANAAQLGVAPADVSELLATSNFRSTHNGVVHVNLNQRYQGREVFGAHVTVSVTASGSVLHAAGSLVPGLTAASSGEPAVPALAAVEAAAQAIGLAEPRGLFVITEEGGLARRTTCSSGGVSRIPIPARLGWQPTAGGLRLAWQLEIDDSSGPHLWNATVAADTGQLLDVADWTSHDPMEELEATLGLALSSNNTFPVGPPNPVIDGSSYRVLAVPTESPNDGPRELISNPADGDASPFGWHDTNGAVGPEFTTTRGNNAHAYLEQDANNQPDFGFDVEGGASLDFDFPADLAEHAQSYRSAVGTNLFYGCNAIHDITWRYGFNEASGNFQANNYGRGGVQGDYVRCEAADGGGTNNANFSTPGMDGGTPRMQMFLWPGNQFGPQNEVVVSGLGSFGSSWARFSPPPTVAGTSGALINAGNGCVAADYAGAPAGDWMAIVTGSNAGCPNIEKARQASAAGAKALIVALNVAGNAPILTGSLTTAAPTIPVASITLADGDAIRAAIAGGPVTGTVRKHPSHPGIRDGDFENGIIFHEYGHGISNRLTGGAVVNCLNGNEQAGEGWSDYFAITLLLNPDLDDPAGPRGMGPYALFQPSRQGNGIRPRPYSRDMTIQPFTYDSIRTGAWLGGISLSLPHGVGHGWASTLWDMNWDLIDKHGFNPDVYGAWNTGGNNRAIQYVIDGLKLQGCSPTFVASRNGILAGTQALGGEDTCTVWAAFARRGLGFSAVPGTTNRDDNSEAFDTHPSCRQGFRPPVDPSYSTINEVTAGSTVPLKFQVTGLSGPNILAENSPFSRRVDCTTLRVPSIGTDITPREYPINTVSPGNSGLKKNGNNTWHYNWKTLAEWAGTCREVVVTRRDGIQHRAFFRFVSD